MAPRAPSLEPVQYSTSSSTSHAASSLISVTSTSYLSRLCHFPLLRDPCLVQSHVFHMPAESQVCPPISRQGVSASCRVQSRVTCRTSVFPSSCHSSFPQASSRPWSHLLTYLSLIFLQHALGQYSWPERRSGQPAYRGAPRPSPAPPNIVPIPPPASHPPSR